MAVADDVKSGIDDVLRPPWVERDGTVVPDTDDITLRDGAVNLDATYVYADLADSSSLGQKLNKGVAAKIMRAYLNAAARVLMNYSGEIRSFDGDRVMAIFIGGAKNANAVRSALALNWAVEKVLKPKLITQWPTLEQYWSPGHGIGIDTGEAMLVRGGVRNNNDLISIGEAPNVAAKLSAIRSSPDIYITRKVYDGMNDENKTSSDGQPMWARHGSVAIGGSEYEVYGSGWYWQP